MLNSVTKNLTENSESDNLVAGLDEKIESIQATLENSLSDTQKQTNVENPYFKKSKILPNTKFVDNMAPVLDRLDLEYEEELKIKPKKTAKKS